MVHLDHEEEVRTEAQEVRHSVVRQEEHRAAPERPEEAQVEPWFPSVDDAVAVNQEALAAEGQTNHALLRPDVLEGALGRAQNHWYYEQSLPKAAAALAHGVGQAQAFEDGNKRTAFHLTHAFLTANDLGHTIPDDDVDLADHLIGYGEGTHGMEDTAQMFEQRIGQQPRQANILDPVHNELDPAVWDSPDSPEPRLRPEHRQWLTETIHTVLDKHGYDGMENWLTLVFTGSLTTYQYSDESDCDVSLFVDTKVFPEWSRAEMIGVMIGNFDGTNLPGTQHVVQGYVVSSKLTPEDLYKPGLRSGYDISSERWIVPPERDRVHNVEREMNEAYTIALESADKMESLLRYEPQKAVQYWHQIHKRRMRDQQAGKGDYSPSNIIYKMLNNRGLFPQISEVSGEYIAKLAAMPTMYHVAPREARESIAREGLSGRHGEWEDMVWLWDHLPTAQANASPEDDVYQVDTQGLEPEAGGNKPSRHGGLAYAVSGIVPPERVRLLE